jgi:hypothetical protein
MASKIKARPRQTTHKAVKQVQTLKQKLTKLARRLERPPLYKPLSIITAVAPVGVIGSYLTFFSRAAVPYASLQAEDSELAGNAAKGNDASVPDGNTLCIENADIFQSYIDAQLRVI